MILVFAGLGYYPAGGAHDLIAVVPDIETAEAALELARLEDDSLEWAHLYDVKRGGVVRHYERDYTRDPWAQGKCYMFPGPGDPCTLTDSEGDGDG